MILDDFYFGKKILLSFFYSRSYFRALILEYRHVYDLAFNEVQLCLQLIYQFLLSLSLCLALFDRLLHFLKISLDLLHFLSVGISSLLDFVMCLISSIRL
jgi:hypothetical protein